MVEFWTTSMGLPPVVVKAATAAEEGGWDGIGVPYAPTMAPDPYVVLSTVAAATSRIKVVTWVATPGSHTPAAAAGSIKTVQAVSDGRAVLGLGRGDSAMAYLGMAPAPVKFFERYVSRLRNYLQDEPQPFDFDLDGGGHFPPVDRLGLVSTATEAKFGLFMRNIPPVPLDLVGTGPKVLGIGARHADHVTTAVGGDPERVAWALGVVRDAREAAGRDASGQSRRVGSGGRDRRPRGGPAHAQRQHHVDGALHGDVRQGGRARLRCRPRDLRDGA